MKTVSYLCMAGVNFYFLLFCPTHNEAKIRNCIDIVCVMKVSESAQLEIHCGSTLFSWFIRGANKKCQCRIIRCSHFFILSVPQLSKFFFSFSWFHAFVLLSINYLSGKSKCFMQVIKLLLFPLSCHYTENTLKSFYICNLMLVLYSLCLIQTILKHDKLKSLGIREHSTGYLLCIFITFVRV